MTFTGSHAPDDDWDDVDLAIGDGIATVTLDRPERLNALTFEVYADLRDLFLQVPQRDDVDVVVLTGRGRAFCSGGDVDDIIGELVTYEARDLLAFTRMTGQVVQHMRECPVPIVAAINGTAAGAGAVLALAADFRLVVEDARFHFLFTQVGLSGGDMGAAWLLPRLVGLGRATEILMFGEPVEADRALEIGLVNRVVAADELVDVTTEFARRLADGPRLGHAMTKLLLTREQEMGLSAALEHDALTQALLMTSADHAEFHRAFTAGEPPRWTGR